MAKYEYTMGKNVELKTEQQKTLDSPVMAANPILRLMYTTMDILYGQNPSLAKFKVLELLARYPYWAWEHGGYVRITRLYSRPKFPKEEEIEISLRHIGMGRRAQDNEQHHLMLIQHVMRQQGIEEGYIRRVLLPRLMAMGYLILTEALYRLKPEWSFAMNARFESHAEHEYMKLVEAHPEWEDEPVDRAWFKHYPQQASLADLFRRIGLDERDHMNESREEYERLTGRELT